MDTLCRTTCNTTAAQSSGLSRSPATHKVCNQQQSMYSFAKTYPCFPQEFFALLRHNRCFACRRPTTHRSRTSLSQGETYFGRQKKQNKNRQPITSCTYSIVHSAFHSLCMVLLSPEPRTCIGWQCSRKFAAVWRNLRCSAGECKVLCVISVSVRGAGECPIPSEVIKP